MRRRCGGDRETPVCIQPRRTRKEKKLGRVNSTRDLPWKGRHPSHGSAGWPARCSARHCVRNAHPSTSACSPPPTLKCRGPASNASAVALPRPLAPPARACSASSATRSTSATMGSGSASPRKGAVGAGDGREACDHDWYDSLPSIPSGVHRHHRPPACARRRPARTREKKGRSRPTRNGRQRAWRAWRG